MKRVRIRLVRSTISQKPKKRLTIRALGLGKIDSVTEKNYTPAIEGMVRSVAHLVEVEEIQES